MNYCRLAFTPEIKLKTSPNGHKCSNPAWNELQAGWYMRYFNQHRYDKWWKFEQEEMKIEDSFNNILPVLKKFQ